MTDDIQDTISLINSLQVIAKEQGREITMLHESIRKLESEIEYERQRLSGHMALGETCPHEV